MFLQGKGFFTFLLRECEGGDPARIVSEAQSAGLSHVLVKIADGVKAFGIDATGDYTAPVVAALRAAGIAVWGWHYVYGNKPDAEAAIAISRTQALGLDGYVVDAEEEYKAPGKETAARQFMAAVRSALTCPIGFSSYRFPDYHPELPWATFLEKSDLHMPQVYWEQATNAGAQLCESKRQCDALLNARPYVPTGAAYGTPPIWNPTPAEITDFLTTAKALGAKAVNFFQWDYCKANLPQLWPMIANFDWPGPSLVHEDETTDTHINDSSIAPTDPQTASFLTALTGRQPAQVAALYDLNAAHVRGNVLCKSNAAVQGDYTALFKLLPAGAPIKLTGAEVSDDVRYLTLQAGSVSIHATLVWKNGKIILDYLCLQS